MIMLERDLDMLYGLLPQFDGEELPADVCVEYDKLIRLKHLVATGPLGLDALAAMIRSLGYEPPEAKKEAVAIDWRKVPPGSTVMAKDELGWKKGELVDCIDNGLLCVKFPGDEFVYEFPSYDVQLTAETTEAADVAQPSTGRDRADITHDEPEIAMEGDWSDVIEGQSVFVEIDDDIAHAEFVALGPHDGEVSVYIGGELKHVPEKSVTLA